MVVAAEVVWLVPGPVCLGTEGAVRSLEACWCKGTGCWGVAGAVGGLRPGTAAGPEEPSAVAGGSSSSHLLLASAGTGGEAGGAAEASHLAAKFLHHPSLAGAQEAYWAGWVSVVLGAGCLLMWVYWGLWCHCYLVMAAPQEVLLHRRQAGPPFACWPSFSEASEPAGDGAGVAAGGACA